MASAPFHYSHRVIYADCTVGNHVYYARYLDFLEAARGAFFTGLGRSLTTLQEEGFIFPVIECRLRYKAPARYDDVLAISLWPTTAEGIRLNFAYRVGNAAGKTVLEGETSHVCTGLNEKPKRMPRELVEKFTPFLAGNG